MPVRSTTQTSWWSPAQSRAAKWACSVQFVFIWRAARIGADRCGPGELIQEPSWGAVLSAFSAAVIAGVGDLRQTLEGLVQKGRGARATEVRPPAFCPAAELFTSSGGAVFPDRFPRWRITPESVSVQSGRGSDVDLPKSSTLGAFPSASETPVTTTLTTDEQVSSARKQTARSSID